MAKKKISKNLDTQIQELEKKRQDALNKAADFKGKIEGLRAKRLEVFCSELIPKLEDMNYTITDETISEVLNSLEISAYAAEKGVTLSKELIDDYVDFTKNKSTTISSDSEKTNPVVDDKLAEKNDKKIADASPEPEKKGMTFVEKAETVSSKSDDVKAELMNRFGSNNIPGMPEM